VTQEEIQAGLNVPLDTTGMDALLKRYLPRIHEAHDAAEGLRNRIANGERTIEAARNGSLKGLSPNAIPTAEKLLEQLRQELRQHDFWLTAGLGMALAYGVAEVIAEAARDEGWKPPAGSLLRIVIQGYVNIAVKLEVKDG
jgi:hypothetical protein